MARAGKRYKMSLEKIEPEKRYSVEEAFNLLDSLAKTKFDETVDVAIMLGIDPKKSDQMVRASISLPHGLGKSVRVLVFAKGEKVKEAEDAGADYVGADDLIEKIQGGWLDFDKTIATPDMMGQVSKLGKVLGPRGLMPNPKLGTVSFDVGKMVREQKAGKVEFKVEKGAIVHAPIGKRSFGPVKLKDNFLTLVGAVQKVKPAAAKGTYIRSISVSSTMSPGIRVDTSQFR